MFLIFPSSIPALSSRDFHLSSSQPPGSSTFTEHLQPRDDPSEWRRKKHQNSFEMALYNVPQYGYLSANVAPHCCELELSKSPCSPFISFSALCGLHNRTTLLYYSLRGSALRHRISSSVYLTRPVSSCYTTSLLQFSGSVAAAAALRRCNPLFGFKECSWSGPVAFVL